MYIKRLSIRNYRCFGDPPFEMDLKPFTLILGENNAGKTNLLNALGLIFSQELAVFRRRILELDDFNYASVTKYREQVRNTTIPPKQVCFPEVKIEVVLTDMDEDQGAVVGDWFSNRELSEAKLTYLFALRPNFKKEEWVQKQRQMQQNEGGDIPADAHIELPVERYGYTIYGGDDPANDCDPYFLRMLKMEFLDALRDAQRELVASGDYRLLYRILSQREDANYEDIRRILIELETAMRSNQNLTDIEREVSSLLERVSLRSSIADNRIAFRFTSPNTSEMLKKIDLRYGSDPINIERNGLGRNNLLYIALVLSHLASRDSTGNDTFFRLIALEEPEAHLHPHLQDHLAKNVEAVRQARDKTLQLLVTSHSTHIAARLGLSNTVIMYREGDTGSIRSHYVLAGLDPDKEKASISYLTRYLDATKSRMFFSRKVILVEGFAEQLLVPKFFEGYFTATLEEMGCGIVNVQGVSFSHFLKIVRNGFFVRCLVLTDQDTGVETTLRATKLKREYDQPGLILVQITDCDTFEKDVAAANKSGAGKATLLAALKAIKSRKGKEIESDFGGSDIDVDVFFGAIQDSKAEFAFSLAAQLEDAAVGEFVIPEYIRAGFEFLR